MEFNLFMQINLLKELETSFLNFVNKLFEEIIVCHLYYITDISTPVHYMMCILMVT